MTVEVVAAAIVRDGRVLAARRRRDGRWEFPGGKVEAGETTAHALRRECREELAVDICVGAELGSAVADNLVLRLFACGLDGAAPTGSADHDRLCWLSAGELQSVDWLPADRVLLAAVTAVLSPSSS